MTLIIKLFYFQMIFLLKDNAIALLFVHLESLKELLILRGLSNVLKYTLEVFIFR